MYKDINREANLDILKSIRDNIVLFVLVTILTIKRLLLTGSLNFKKWLNKKDRTVTIKIRWILVGFLLLALWPRPSHIIYREPVAPAPPIIKVKPLKPLAQSTLSHVEGIQPVFVPAPVIQSPQTDNVAPAGCVSGYSTGNPEIDYMINHESGGNSCATNYSGCYGLLQACPGYPLKVACGGDPACQITWFANNKLGAYGSWAEAYAHEIADGWW